MSENNKMRSILEIMNDVLSTVRDYYDSEYAYYIEKDENAKNTQKQDDNVRVLITDILKKPRLDNIKTEYTEKSEYGDCFENLFLKVRNEVGFAAAYHWFISHL